MPPKKRIRFKSTSIADNELLKQLELMYVCGYCSKIVEGNGDAQLMHALSHENEITQCRTCIMPVKLGDETSHVKEFHTRAPRPTEFFIDKSLIELRIDTGKAFSSFWGLSLSSTDVILSNFGRYSLRLWNHYKNRRYLGIFRLYGSKIHWKCPFCLEKPAMGFNETISMRAYALSHLEESHFVEITENDPAFFNFEWFCLNDECDFDVRAMMEIAQQRRKVPDRSYLSYYTVNIPPLENGENFINFVKRRNQIEGSDDRYCLVCCSFVPIKSIKSHFNLALHATLEAVSSSTSFTLLRPNKTENLEMLTEKEIKKEIVEETTDNDDEHTFRFPEQLFLYSQEYVNSRRDEFKWRCCLCPRAHATTFATFIILRMFALRHIEERHRMLFTEEFLSYEWKSIQREMLASFDLRAFTPIEYTLRGEGTFNNRDPNDYMLPQQYYFLPKECSRDTVICGFCYRSFNRFDFLPHITLHGFMVDSSKTCLLRPVVFNEKACQLMGQEKYTDEDQHDEPCRILSIAGKRLESKINLMNSRIQSNIPYLSDVTTPCKSERETDSESQTPRSRKSAMDAKRILSETFKVLQENARNRKNTWNEYSSCSSSSSDDEDSEEERYEKELDLQATTVAERAARSKSLEKLKKIDLSTMRPAEIQEMIRKEAEKKGVKWNINDSSESSSSSDDSESDEEVPEGNKLRNMKPGEIKALIRQAAKRKQIKLSSGSSSSDSD
ncbi:hypothetical protein L5515_001887 [Caenorhabditis briggsae]|uniref:Uncharacterized protein n=1 Tax=Caenorhabditis briggsae TaxID=6238 RepID=A0AAE9E6H7_CAEBR|nr:hypothetical protein L5515_001887 [Caenorhabditis briggsae]